MVYSCDTSSANLSPLQYLSNAIAVAHHTCCTHRQVIETILTLSYSTHPKHIIIMRFCGAHTCKLCMGRIAVPVLNVPESPAHVRGLKLQKCSTLFYLQSYIPSLSWMMTLPLIGSIVHSPEDISTVKLNDSEFSSRISS